HALANDDPLSGLELDFESHVLWSSHIAGLRTIIVVPGVNARLTTVFTREPLKLKRRGFLPAVGLPGRAGHQGKRLRTFLSAWEAIDKAVEDSCCRVCNDSRLAPSSLVSASTRASAPVLSVLIVDLVKSWRICTIDRLAPKVDACERNVASAVV